MPLTQADLDRGLTDEQLDWLGTHLNLKALFTALRGMEPRIVGEDIQNATPKTPAEGNRTGDEPENLVA